MKRIPSPPHKVVAVCCHGLLHRAQKMAGALAIVPISAVCTTLKTNSRITSPASWSSCQVNRLFHQGRRDSDPQGMERKVGECISGGTWASGQASQSASGNPPTPQSSQPSRWLFSWTSNFLPTLEKEKLLRLFKDFPDFKNRHSSEHKSLGTRGWGGGGKRTWPAGVQESPRKRDLLEGFVPPSRYV